MDTNPVAPFDMYSDEYILWIENKKGYFLKDAIRANVWIASIIFAFTIVFTLLSVFFDGENTLVSLLAFGGYFFLASFIFAFFIQQSMHIKQNQTTYYITNFRIIRYHAYKKPIYYYDFIDNIADIYIKECKETGKTIELSWIIQDANYATIYCFENIDNIDKIYDIIISQKLKLESTDEMVFYSIPQ